MQNYDEILQKVRDLNVELTHERRFSLEFKNNILTRLDQIQYGLCNDIVGRLNILEERAIKSKEYIGRLEDRISFLQGSLVQGCINQDEKKDETIKIQKDTLERVLNSLNIIIRHLETCEGSLSLKLESQVARVELYRIRMCIKEIIDQE